MDVALLQAKLKRCNINQIGDSPSIKASTSSRPERDPKELNRSYFPSGVVDEHCGFYLLTNPKDCNL